MKHLVVMEAQLAIRLLFAMSSFLFERASDAPPLLHFGSFISHTPGSYFAMLVISTS